MRTSLPVLPDRSPLAAAPHGWYVVTASDALRPGAMLPVRLAGRELLAWRAASGAVTVSDAYCPHLGARFASGGCVKGEHLWCPFHAFEFDATGACVKTGYGTRPPPAARLATLPVIERHGVVHAWLHPAGGAPLFDLPTLDESGWTPWAIAGWDLTSHPQETSENSVDIGHLKLVHGYEDVVALGTRTEGGYLNSKFSFRRRDGVLGKYSRPLDVSADVHLHGLGVSIVETVIPTIGVRTRQCVYSTPTDAGRIHLRIAMSLHIERASTVHPALAVVPAGVARRFALAAAFRQFKTDVRQDFDIWNNKVYVPRPALADGPVGVYRRWTRQFYPPPAAPDAADA
jgi:nitrite reductase/ring-hydroxylating ferredoxin subunit